MPKPTPEATPAAPNPKTVKAKTAPIAAPSAAAKTGRRRGLRRWRRPAQFALIVVASALASWAAWGSGHFAWRELDSLAWDFAFRARGPQSVVQVMEQPNTAPILCVKTSHALPRSVLAGLVSKMKLARAVALDFMLVDNAAELTEDEKELYTRDLARWKADDAVLARATRENGRVLMALWPEESRPTEPTQVLGTGSPESAEGAEGTSLTLKGRGSITSEKLDSDFASGGQEWRSPPPGLTRASRGLGHVVIAQESGVLRRVRLWQATPGGPVPCMGLAIAALASGQSPQEFARGKGWVQSEGSAMVDWLGGREVFEQEHNSIDYTMALLWEPEFFRDKIVLIGEVSRQSKEIVLTPWGEVPALQAHATVAAMLLSPQGPPAPLPSTWTLALCVLSAALVLVPLWKSGAGMVGCFVGLLAQCVGLALVGAWLFTTRHMLLPASAPVASALFCFTLLSLYEHRRARQTLGRLVGVGQISRALHPLATLEPGEGDSREEEATAFFCDLRGYSTLSEELRPRETSDLVNAYFTFLVRAIHPWGGRVIDYQGDAIFVVFEALDRKGASPRSSTWGAPGAPEDAGKHATRAVRAALEVVGGIRDFSAAWEPIVGRELAVGIGLQSGPMQIGLIGSAERAHFGVVGDSVNVAARVQGFSKSLPAPIILGEGTHAALAAEGSLPLFDGPEAEIAEFGAQEIRGRAGQVRLWGVRPRVAP